MSYQQRLLRLQAVLQKADCDAIIIEEKVNLFYLTGMQLSAGKLLVHLQGAHLLVDGRYIEACKKQSPFPVILADPAQKCFMDLLKASPSIHSLAFDSASTSYQSYSDLQACLNRLDKEQGTRQLKLVPMENPVKQLRSVKDSVEIALLREAAELGTRGFEFARSLLKEGVTEVEVATELEIFWKRCGGKSLAFDPIVAFGANSSMPHYRAGDAVLIKGDCVLIDIGVNLAHYHSDMTRVLSFGDPHPKIVEIHRVVQQAQQKALEMCRPGTLINDLDDAARSFIASQGYGEYFTHSLGHGVGLEIHELPLIRNIPANKGLTLQAGMVITIEPGVYLQHLGGVRIEDTVVITADGYENLTNYSTELI